MLQRLFLHARPLLRIRSRLLMAVLVGCSAAAMAAEPEAAKEKVPGVVIDHIAAKTGQYIGSPSIAVLPNGDYVASHDFFGKGSTCDQSVVFGSKDRGATWTKLAQLDGQWWSNLFVHQGALYILGVSHEYGHVVIRRSSDGGRTWTTPKDKRTGLLLDDGNYHCAPVPVILHAGRLWRAMEQSGSGATVRQFRSFMMSAPVDADLLDAGSWTSTNRVPYDTEWLGGKMIGWLEGNAVLTPERRIVNILRAEYRVEPEKAAVIQISEDGRQATFDPQTGFIDFPGGCKKFTIRYDETSKQYWTLSNYVPPGTLLRDAGRTRNTLALVCSRDLRNWQVRDILLHHPDAKTHAFQYVDWLFEGDDIIAVSRTAYDDGEGGAHSAHDANYLTFHRFKEFRTRTGPQ